MKGKCDIVLTDLMIKTYKVWRYRLNYVLSKYTQMTRTSPYVGSSHANIQLKNTTASLQDKQSFWKDVSEDKLWETRKQRMLDSKARYNIRPQKQK